jgi:hypothetical protein
MVQNGKFADCAFALDKQLNRVDFPTFGSPTIPHFKAILLYLLIFGAKINDSANYKAIILTTMTEIIFRNITFAKKKINP